jgi:hypothetical protein
MFSMLLPTVSIANGGVGIGTNLTADTSGGQSPLVLAKWEANPCGRDEDDDFDTPGAQFHPTGVKDLNRTIAICAIVTDPDGLADVSNVYADVFYPEYIALGTHHESLPEQSGLGCGELMQEDVLSKLDKMEGYNLFCDDVYNGNNNLPTFNDGYDYTAICKADGYLMKETAAVYCTEKDLSYEDPDGDYMVWAVAVDKVGNQGILENYFTYLPLTAFETDFNNVSYGSVRLNTEKIVSGDLNWHNTINGDLPSIRNVGNTRAVVSIEQDDMGFGMTSGNYNVAYRARLGSDEYDWADYGPFEDTILDDSLDLSELDEMDFAITVSKFPPTHSGPYSGEMTLSAYPIEHLFCAGSKG